MFFVWLGSILFGICVLVGEYLLIRLAVRDGIDSSSAADWKEMYALEQERTSASLPSLDNMYRNASELSTVASLPADQRHDEIERIVAGRARKVVRESRRKRFTLTVVGIVIGAVVSGIMVFGGLHAAESEREETSYRYMYSYGMPSSAYDPSGEYPSLDN